MNEITERIRLENWCIGAPECDGYRAPETQRKVLGGVVYGHPRFKDGSKVTCSTVVKVDGNKVDTYSGSKYVLGNIDPDYEKWIKENYKDFDPKNPIKLVEYIKLNK